METASLLLHGFANALSLQNLLFALIGCVLGTLVGVLPGIGPTAGIAMLLPITGVLPPAPAIIMLGAIYYGAMYGGSTTSILMNVPGEIASVVTCLDGYEMAKQGRAAAALAIAAISSFVAGTLGLVGLTLFSPPLAGVALKMGPPETFGLIFFASTMVISMAGRSLLKGMVSAALGMLICLVGIDPTVGVQRLTFGVPALDGGFNIVAVVMGLFAMKEVFQNLGAAAASISQARLGSWRKMITWGEIRECNGTMLRATVVGFFLGCIPGFSPSAISFLSYDAEKRLSGRASEFGKGAIQGVAAPEGANNSATSGGFVPLFTLGIPPSPALAVLLSGLMIYGLQPGPLLFEKQPLFVWTVIASMYIGNVMLLILNLPLVGLWAKMVKVPYYYIAPSILLFCFLGTYSVRDSFFDVGTCLAFGLVAILLEKLEIPTLPLVISLILTPMLEDALRQTISLGGGSLTLLWHRPIALALCVAGMLAMAFALAVRFGWLATTRAGKES